MITLLILEITNIRNDYITRESTDINKRNSMDSFMSINVAPEMK